MLKLTRKTVAVSAALMLMGVGGVAFAYWTNSGSGTGSATTGTNEAITVIQTVSSAVLVPGGPASTLSGTFTNPNTSPVFVNTVTATLASVTGGGVAPDQCTVADYQLDTATITLGAQVAVNDSTTWSGIQVSMINSATNQDKCKNATINLSYTSN